jgi:esterase/lipase superfamily enzyme
MTDTPSLDSLLAALEAAVRDQDRARAIELERVIAQHLEADAADREAQERRLRALMEQLEAPPPLVLEPFSELKTLNPFTLERGAAPAAEQGVDYPVWFATNRKPEGQNFGGERSETVTHGRVLVHVPKAHRFGETGSSWWTRLWRGDDQLRVKEIAAAALDVFYDGLRQALAEAREDGAPQALVFLHGYNVSFADAAIRTAQIGCDLKVPGPVAFFSWPSRASASAYPADEASIEASERHIADFLVDFAARCRLDDAAPRLHLIAHSMGNRGLLRALQRIASDAQTRGKVKFDQIILAAPDVDRDLFLDLAALYRQHAERVTLYASGADLPVHLSSRLHDAPRAGYFKPYTVAEGVDTIAVPDFDVDLLGHSYFAQAEALLHDIYDLLRLADPHPKHRQRIVAATEDGVSFWALQR